MSFTYGEVVFEHFVAVLDYVKPKEGEVFWDLGCGAGRPLVAASLAFANLKACKGLELLEQLTLLGQEVASRTDQACAQIEIEHAPIEVIQGDILTHDWFDADLIYLSAVCFSEELVAKVADLLSNVKKGVRIVSLRPLPPRDHLHQFASIEAKMSWGLGRVFYSRTI